MWSEDVSVMTEGGVVVSVPVIGTVVTYVSSLSSLCGSCASALCDAHLGMCASVCEPSFESGTEVAPADIIDSVVA